MCITIYLIEIVRKIESDRIEFVDGNLIKINDVKNKRKPKRYKCWWISFFRF